MTARREIAPREIARREIAPREIVPREIVPREIVPKVPVNLRWRKARLLKRAAVLITAAQVCRSMNLERPVFIFPQRRS